MLFLFRALECSHKCATDESPSHLPDSGAPALDVDSTSGDQAIWAVSIREIELHRGSAERTGLLTGKLTSAALAFLLMEGRQCRTWDVGYSAERQYDTHHFCCAGTLEMQHQVSRKVRWQVTDLTNSLYKGQPLLLAVFLLEHHTPVSLSPRHQQDPLASVTLLSWCTGPEMPPTFPTCLLI